LHGWPYFFHRLDEALLAQTSVRPFDVVVEIAAGAGRATLIRKVLAPLRSISALAAFLASHNGWRK